MEKDNGYEPVKETDRIDVIGEVLRRVRKMERFDKIMSDITKSLLSVDGPFSGNRTCRCSKLLPIESQGEEVDGPRKD